MKPCKMAQMNMQEQHDVPFDEGASMVSGTLYLSNQEHRALLNIVHVCKQYSMMKHIACAGAARRALR